MAQRPLRSGITVRSNRNVGEESWSPNNLIFLLQEKTLWGSKASMDICKHRHTIVSVKPSLYSMPLWHCCPICLLFTLQCTSHLLSSLQVFSSAQSLASTWWLFPQPPTKTDLIRISKALCRQGNYQGWVLTGHHFLDHLTKLPF